MLRKIGAHRGAERRGAGMFGRTRLIGIIYLAIGVVVAASKDYFDGINNIEGVISAALGVVLWPLLLLDVNLRIGRLDDDGGRRRGLVWVPALAHTTRCILDRIRQTHSH